MSICCWIVDDEPAAHKGIELALAAHKDFFISYHAWQADEVLMAIEDKTLENPDVVFLDIEMPGKTGFDLIAALPEPLPVIVFVTAYNQFALQAFDSNALDYLLKPIEQSRFDVMTEKVRQRLKEQQTWHKRQQLQDLLHQVKAQHSLLGLTIHTDDGLLRLKQKDIVYLEAAGDHLALYYKEQVLITRDSFKRLATELDPQFFYRTHKSFMVNLAHVVRLERGRFGDGIVHLSQNKQAKLSRRYKDILAALSK